ncbi:MAG: SOS response-associated peptidase [bacterium]
MCGRYSLSNPDADLLRRRFNLRDSVEVPAQQPRFNVAPTDPVLAVRETPQGQRDLGTLRWGLVPGRWAERGGRPLINARAETLQTQPAFRDSFRERRCLIPADGFYEWLSDDRGKRPLWFSRPGGELFAFAGIWAGLPERAGDGVLHSCAIITCEPNELLRPVHNRMPAILEPDLEGAWLSPDAEPEDLRRLLRPAPEEMLTAREVGDFVNNVREDGPHLIEPRKEQKSLF